MDKVKVGVQCKLNSLVLKLVLVLVSTLLYKHESVIDLLMKLLSNSTRSS